MFTTSEGKNYFTPGLEFYVLFTDGEVMVRVQYKPIN